MSEHRITPREWIPQGTRAQKILHHPKPEAARSLEHAHILLPHYSDDTFHPHQNQGSPSNVRPQHSQKLQPKLLLSYDWGDTMMPPPRRPHLHAWRCEFKTACQIWSQIVSKFLASGLLVPFSKNLRILSVFAFCGVLVLFCFWLSVLGFIFPESQNNVFFVFLLFCCFWFS